MEVLHRGFDNLDIAFQGQISKELGLTQITSLNTL